MRTPVFIIDRAFLKAPGELAEALARHLSKGEIVQVEDTEWPARHRLRYIIQWVGDAGHVFDDCGERLGVFADLAALVEHAETMTA